jgi:hypothetical protein
MVKQLITGASIAFLLALGTPVGIAARQTATDDAHKAGQDAKQAGKDAGEAAKNGGKAVAKGAKKAAKKTGHAAKKGANAVKDAVTPDTTSAACKDGTVQTGKTKTTACAGHGGVQG